MEEEIADFRQYILERRYNCGNSYSRGYRGRFRGGRGYRDSERPNNPRRIAWDKRCHVCGKMGCYSTNHTPEERKASRLRWLRDKEFSGNTDKRTYGQYLMDFEGSAMDDEEDDVDVDVDTHSQYVATAWLCNQAFLHQLTGDNPIAKEEQTAVPAAQFVLSEHDHEKFQGIMPDIGAAGRSTVGIHQALALQYDDPLRQIDKSRDGEVFVAFGDGDAKRSIGVIAVDTPFGQVDFHVLNVATPFLLSLRDMDILKVECRTLSNRIIQPSTGITLPITRKWGHAWFFLDHPGERTCAWLTKAQSYDLTEKELRRLHRRFGHPSVKKLENLLTNAGVNVNREALEMMSKFCHHCQLKGTAPKRFKFAIKGDSHFNHDVIVDICWIDSKPVLHVVDASTSFQSGKFLKNMQSNTVWEAFRQCWTDTYLGPPDVITTDAGTNLTSEKFVGEAKALGIVCHEVPVEAHNSIGKVERYHAPLRRAYEIISVELGTTVPAEVRLQMALKAINDTAGPNGLVPTLLVFGTYPRMTTDSPPTASMVERAKAIEKASAEIRNIMSKRKVADALNARNGPLKISTLPRSLAIDSDVLVWREKDPTTKRAGWTGPYKVIRVDDNDVMVQLENTTSKFRSTVVKPYYRVADGDEIGERAEELRGELIGNSTPAEKRNAESDESSPQLRRSAREHVTPRHRNDLECHTAHLVEKVYLSLREKASMEASVRLRAEGKIAMLGAPFEQSDAIELEGLSGSGTLVPEIYDEAIHGREQIFGSRMVHDVKGQMTDAPYEKSRLVVQGYGDEKKDILTQSPTIMRSSQRLILALAPSLQRDHTIKLATCDITQAYTQSKTQLKRAIWVKLPKELENKFPKAQFYESCFLSMD